MTTTSFPDQPVRADLRIGRLIGAEMTKLRGTPSVWWLSALAMGAVLLGIVITLSTQDIESGAQVRALLSYSTASGVVIILLGLVWAAGEYRHRTIVPAVLITPRRTPFVLAQVLALGLAGVLVGLAGTALAGAVGLGYLATQEGAPRISALDFVWVAVGTMAYSGIAGALGGGLGALIRNQVAAAIAIFLYLSMVDPLVAMALPDYGQFGPTVLGMAMTGVDPEVVSGPGAQMLSPVMATAIWFAYAGALIVAAVLATRRRELS